MTDAAWVVIPARGGSKGLPRKNLQMVGGMSLVERAVVSGLEAQLVAEVVVSTDDVDIAELAASKGARVVWRPADLSTDESSSESAVVHGLEVLRDEGIELPRKTAMVQCTSPFVQGRDIDGCIRVLEHFDSCITVTEDHSFQWQIAADGSLETLGHDAAIRLRRQDLPPRVRETGAVCAFDTLEFMRLGQRFYGSVGYFLVDRARAIEIDDEADLHFARQLSLKLGDS